MISNYTLKHIILIFTSIYLAKDKKIYIKFKEKNLLSMIQKFIFKIYEIIVKFLFHINYNLRSINFV